MSTPDIAAGQESARRIFTERTMYPVSGWLLLLAGACLAVAGAGALALEALDDTRVMSGGQRTLAGGAIVVGLFVLRGLFLIQPNQAVILTFFGTYRGSVRANGLRWTLPLYSRRMISLRLNTLDSNVLKVNDRAGNPIEVSAVIVWRVGDTARAAFAVDNYREFVAVQSEAAIRDVTASYDYDADDDHTLRGDGQLIAADLAARVAQRLEPSGVIVEEARLNHLAYAPEIAGAMLRRQQAQAIVAARSSIVEGAVQIARHAVQALRADGSVVLTDAQQADVVSSLLVVLCSETAATPTLPIR